MSAGYVYIFCKPSKEGLRITIHIGVGFCVARSGSDGQCEGLDKQDE